MRATAEPDPACLCLPAGSGSIQLEDLTARAGVDKITLARRLRRRFRWCSALAGEEIGEQVGRENQVMDSQLHRRARPEAFLDPFQQQPGPFGFPCIPARFGFSPRAACLGVDAGVELALQGFGPVLVDESRLAQMHDQRTQEIPQRSFSGIRLFSVTAAGSSSAITAAGARNSEANRDAARSSSSLTAP